MKILVIDDDKMICFALKTIIEANEDMEVVGIGHSYEDALILYKKTRPEIALFDIRIGEKTGLDALEAIKKEDPSAKVLFLTTFLDDSYVKTALSLGSYGYILKDDFENIAPAIRSVFAGQTVFGKEVLSSMNKKETLSPITKTLNPSTSLSVLSERELEVLRLISDGRNNKEIATSLFLSEGTVRNYISSMLEKLSLRDRTQLAIFYLTNNEASPF